MSPKAFVRTAMAALAASSLVSAQTTTECNPMEKSCSPDPAMGTTVTCDFTRGKCGVFEPLAGTSIKYDDDGAVFNISSASDAPTIMSKKYIFFGRVEVTLRCAPGSSIVSAATLLSDNLDEIDFEWIGSDNSHVQSNYFGKTDKITWDRGGVHSVSNPSSDFHKYTMEWTKNSIQWLVDDTLVRELKYQDANGGFQYPQTPMQIKLGTWSPKEKGSQEWAGGPPDFSKGPFLAHFKSIVVVDYAGGDKPADGGVKEYVWGDKSGRWESIHVVKDNGELQNNEEAGTKTSSTSASDRTSTSIGEMETSLTSTMSSSSTYTTRGGNSSGLPETTKSGSTAGSTSAKNRPIETTTPQSSAMRLLVSFGSAACILVGLVGQHLF